MHVIIFASLLLSVCCYSLWKGDRDGKLVALICIGASLITPLLLRPVLHRYTAVEVGALLVDVVTFCGFTFIALSSSRFWPLWIAGLQLTTLLGHMMKQLDLELLPRAYGVAAIFWSYPILLVLAAATWRAQRRRTSLSET